MSGQWDIWLPGLAIVVGLAAVVWQDELAAMFRRPSQFDAPNPPAGERRQVTVGSHVTVNGRRVRVLAVHPPRQPAAAEVLDPLQAEAEVIAQLRQWNAIGWVIPVDGDDAA